MKRAVLSCHRQFPETPVSFWVGARSHVLVSPPMVGGQRRRPQITLHPFSAQRRLWCQLSVDYSGVALRFSTPQELDHVLSVLSRNPLPSGHGLVPGWKVGRPVTHWLSRLPGKAKPWKFRQRLCTWLSAHPVVAAFRRFYEGQPVIYVFAGFDPADPPVSQALLAARRDLRPAPIAES